MAAKILDTIHGPEDLHGLSFTQLEDLAQELRQVIMEVVSKNGGHLASNLGVVELTLALHRVFRSPHDKIIWDVGHQCYTHKLITGRKDRFHTLRTLGGMSGFPRRAESPHDIVETGHASTSISVALGLLSGQKLTGIGGKVVAVIGDGALTGGVALEALNQAAGANNDLIIVLNDNKKSISDNVGAISYYLSRLTATRLYQTFRKRFDRAVEQIPWFGRDLLQAIQRLKKGVKALFFRETLFSDLGFEYFGPIDGHNLPMLVRILKDVKKLDKPTVVHVCTLKGKGYIPAEGDPTLYHGVSPFSIVDGKLETKDAPSFTEVFSGLIADLAQEDQRIVAITAAMANGTGLRLFQTRFPDRFFDVGIAEQHAVTFASGLARAGLKPVVAIYSTFLQRAVDQVIHDVALPRLPVVFAVDRAGLVGPDGETHQGAFDIALFRSIPGLSILAPSTHKEMELMLRYAFGKGAPVMIRYPKAPCCPGQSMAGQPLLEGRGVLVRQNRGEVLIAAFGALLEEALQAADLLNGLKIPADVYNLRFLQPLDMDHLVSLFYRYRLVCLVEEGCRCGGIGEKIAADLKLRGTALPFLHLGFPRRFLPHGSRREQLALYGLDGQTIAAAVEQAFAAANRLVPSTSLHI
ncbi:MAG: 1-deoxy-D-xylulose-5-phosphate synthase [Spirochaetaceae bacterium]|nr:MAG: 1-deoxy-D-xylulose-5-phosphate synthase [Spirochaetaceae bacterium]